MIFPRMIKKENKLIISIVVVSLLLILLGILLLGKGDSRIELIPEPLTNEEIVWVTYVNEEYEFELEYPKHWQVYEEDNNLSPKINIYPFQSDVELPLDHFKNANHFSIYPKGIPSEGLIGQSREIEVDADFDVEIAREFYLMNGSTWATMISFKDFPENWKPWGFVWSSAVIEDLEYKCKQGEIMASIDVCNPFEGDEIIRAGKVDEDIIEIEKEIIKSFRFID